MSDKDKETELLLKVRDLTGEAFALASKRLRDLKDQTEETNEKSTASWGKLFATIGGGVAIGNLISHAFQSAAGILASVPGQLLEVAKRGNDVADVRDSYMKLNAAIGQLGTEALPQIRAAFGRTVNDYELMRSSNEALSKGVKLTAADMATMAKASRVMSDQVGGDSKEKWDAMMDAIATGRDKQLRELPLDYAKIEKAVDAHAAKLGVERSALTLSQQQIALRNAVLQESKRILEENGEVQNDFNDNLEAAGAQWQNIKDRVGEAIAQSPSLNVALNKAGEALTAAFGPDRDAQIASIGVVIGKVAIAAVTGATYIVSAAQTIASAYYKARAAVDTLFDAYNQKEIARVQHLVDVYQDMVDKGTKSAVPRLQQLQIELAGLKGASQGLTDDANDSLETNEKLQRKLGEVNKKVADLAASMRTAEAAAQGADKGTKPLIQTHQAAAEGVNANAKATEDFTKKVRAMTADVAVAIQNGSLDTWAKRNATALQDLVERSVELGQQLPANIKKAFQQSAVLGLDADSGKKAEKIMADNVAAVKKALEERGKLWMAGNDQIAASEQAAADIRVKMRTSEYEYQVDTIKAETVAKRAALDAHASNYEATLRAIDAETAARMEEAKTIHNAKLAEMQAATNSWGNLTKSWLGQIPGLLQAAFTGGGGFAGAMKGLLSGIGGDLGAKVFGGPDGLGQKVAEGLLGKGASGAVAGKIGGFVGMIGGPMGSMAVSLGLKYGKQLWDHFFGTAGRDAVKDFAATFKGGFDGPDGLHAALLKAGAAGEAMWIKITQGTKKGDAKAAAANIAEAKALIAKAAAEVVHTIDDDIADAGFKTRDDLQRTADTAQRVYEAMRDSGKFTASAIQEAWEKAQAALVAAGDENAIAAQKTKDAIAGIDGQIKSLEDSFAGEAPEEYMGAVEAAARKSVDALKEQRAQMLKEQNAQQTATQDAADQTGEGVDSIKDKADDALDSFKKWGDAIRDAADAARGFPSSVGSPTGYPGGGATGTAHATAATMRGDYVTAGAFRGPGGSTSGVRSQTINLFLDKGGRKALAQAVLEEQPALVGAYGGGRR